MGVVLTLAILAGLLITAVPVSAAVQSWSTIKGPPVSVRTSANVFAFAGDGTTVYLYANSSNPADNYATYNATTADCGKLWKSTDAGITWSSTNLDTGAILTNKFIKSLKVNKSSASDLVATDGENFYRSTNSGRTWGVFTLPDDFSSGVINTIDVANGENGIAYLAATNDGVFLYDSDLLVWTLLDTTNWSGSALAAAFSPNYENVPIIVAVALDSALIVKTMLVTNPTTSEWGGTIMDCTIKNGAEDAAAADTSIASIAFPSNYSSTSSTSRVFIGIGETAAADTAVGVYRINGGTSISTSYNLGANINVSSLAYKGTISSGTLVAGSYSDFVISSTTNVSSNSPTWSDSTNSPFGDNTGDINMAVAFPPSSSTLYAGATGLGSGLATSKDFLSFAQISFVSVSSYANVTMPIPGGGLTNAAGVVRFQQLNDNGTSANMIFKSTDSGATWAVIYNNKAFNNGPINVFSTTPGDKDFQTLWIWQPAPNFGDKYVKSTDGGANWDTFNFPSIMGQVNAEAVIDANSFWMGSAAGIRKSTSTAIANIDGKTPLALITIPNFFVIPSTSGEIYISKDDGATFDRLGSIGQFYNGTGFSPARSTFAFNGKNWTVYAVDVSSGNILQWVYGVDSSWSIALSAAKMPAELQGYANLSGISIGGGGVWYVQRPASGDIPQLWRAVDPLNTNPDNYYGFEPIDGTSSNNLGGSVMAIPTLTTVVDADGIPTYHTRIQGDTTTNKATNKYPSTWVKFTDVLIAAPKITVPTEGAVVGTTVTITQGQAGNQTAVDFTWSPVAYTGARYGYQIAYDAGFTNIAATNIPADIDSTSGTSGTTLSSINLLAGKKYFFRVKVLFPMMSKWSTAVSFNTMIPSDVNQGLNAEGRISPINGSSGVPLTPAITWGAVNSATSYDFKLATDATFTTIVEAKDGLSTTVFSPSQPLKPNTVYFWEVRANAYTNVGNWVVSAFTTGAAASTGGTTTGGQPIITVNPPAVTVNPPAVNIPPAQITVAPPNVTVNPAAPETPAYIWIIIAIGAVLVIAVIVLIARTRRV